MKKLNNLINNIRLIINMCEMAKFIIFRQLSTYKFKKERNMTINVQQRVINVAEYIIKHKTTVRATAKIYNVSKSTIHNDLQKRLPKINKKYYFEISKILQFNFEQKHLRGGKATKEKYLKEKECIKNN